MHTSSVLSSIVDLIFAEEHFSSEIIQSSIWPSVSYPYSSTTVLKEDSGATLSIFSSRSFQAWKLPGIPFANIEPSAFSHHAARTGLILALTSAWVLSLLFSPEVLLLPVAFMISSCCARSPLPLLLVELPLVLMGSLSHDFGIFIALVLSCMLTLES